MQVLRTPDTRFEALVGFPFAPHYSTVRDADGTELRIHYVDEGPRDADPILLLHGNPTWSYLYRHMIPGLMASGRRVIAVDLVGCGRSDKPAAKSDYTLARHYDWMSKWLMGMDLRHITLFCQDWGGTIGLYLVSQHPERFDRVIASNTGLPLGEGETGFIQFPMLIAVQTDNPGAPINREAWARLARFEKPFLTLFGDLDPVSRGWEKRAQEHIPGARGRAHHNIAKANHFIQEDAPEELVTHILRFLDAT